MQQNLFVSTQWLADNPHPVKIIEGALSPANYLDKHIPGSLFWDLSPDMRPSQADPAKARARWQKQLRSFGIERDDTLIFTGDFPMIGGALAWRALLFGLPNVHVLNGGSAKWHRENRPHESGDAPAVAASEITLDAPNLSGWAVSADVERAQRAIACGDAATALLDVRTPQEYEGELFMTAPPTGDEIAGHIQGATLVPCDIVFHEDGTLRDSAAIRALYAQHGIFGDRDIIAYCTVGGRSAFTALVLEQVCGFERVRNYVGSWSEWSQREVNFR